MTFDTEENQLENFPSDVESSVGKPPLLEPRLRLRMTQTKGVPFSENSRCVSNLKDE